MTDAPTEREGEGAWTKLRRRKVVQWGIAYAAGAWGLLQGLQYVSGLLNWPPQLQKLAGLALLIGLPIVLVLAWYHGDRGEQRVSRAELAILTLLVLVGGGIFWRYERASDTPSTPPKPGAASVSPTSTGDIRPSIAVLPFENRSDEHKDAFFVDGIHDDILTQLSKISALKVISRTSVEQFRDTKLPTKAIADQLGVKSILEGGVQRAGDRVRINVQLIDAGTDAHLWAETYDRELTAENIFSIQTELAAAIAGALKAALTPAEKARASVVATRNLEAWEAYQLGKQRMARRTTESLAEAEKFFRKSIELDSQFALAYVGLADTLALQVTYSGTPEKAAFAEADGAATTALKLDPNLAEAWTSAANVAGNRNQKDRAEQMYARAIELNPNYATAHMWFSELLSSVGRKDEALTHARRAVDLDPLSAINNKNLAAVLLDFGRFKDAEARYLKVIEIDPSMPAPYLEIANLRAYSQDRLADAVRFVQKSVELDPGQPGARLALGWLYLDLGEYAEASRELQVAVDRWPDNAGVHLFASALALCRGERDLSLRYAQTALESDPLGAGQLSLLGNADLLAGHPEFALARYAKAYPTVFVTPPPAADPLSWGVALAAVPVLQKMGEDQVARALLGRVEEFIRTIPRLGGNGYGIGDVSIHALRGEKAKALAALREAERVGWRGSFWRYYRDFDPTLASIRNEPEFKAVFADIERDMAAQRAQLAARPKDAPLDLAH